MTVLLDVVLPKKKEKRNGESACFWVYFSLFSRFCCLEEVVGSSGIWGKEEKRRGS